MGRIKRPTGIRFGCGQSRRNFEEVRAGDHIGFNLRRIIVISGLAGTGKSRLARAILAPIAGPNAVAIERPTKEGAMLRAAVAGVKRGYLFLDNWSARQVKSPVLECLATSKMLSYQERGEWKKLPIPDSFTIVITGCDLVLGEAMRRRSIGIVLKGMEVVR